MKARVFYMVLACALAACAHQNPTSQAVHDWTIKPSGVGSVLLGKPVPASVLALDHTPYDRLVLDGVPDRGFRLEAVDLEISLSFRETVRRLFPGPGLKTAAGTGAGSTLEALRQAHGKVNLHDIPEPYRCAVTTPSLADVYFEFLDCDAARSGAKVIRVVIWRWDDSDDG